MARQMRREYYAVGWVCALPVELAAAQERLDEEHSDFERDAADKDKNPYVLGSIGGHNVVIVSARRLDWQQPSRCSGDADASDVQEDPVRTDGGHRRRPEC